MTVLPALTLVAPEYLYALMMIVLPCSAGDDEADPDIDEDGDIGPAGDVEGDVGDDLAAAPAEDPPEPPEASEEQPVASNAIVSTATASVGLMTLQPGGQSARRSPSLCGLLPRHRPARRSSTALRRTAPRCPAQGPAARACRMVL